MSPSQVDTPRGILRGPHDADGIEHERFAPIPALDPFVAHFWAVHWDLRDRPPFVAETLPHPCVHVLFERGRAQIAGVPTRIFRRRLRGHGRVFGIKFRPAAFQPILRAPVSRITDRVLSMRAVFGNESDSLKHAMLAETDVLRCVKIAQDFLKSHLPLMPAPIAELRDLVDRLATDQSITRVEQAAALAGMELRQLQRRFSTAVGVSPKWVIQRYRLHEAAEQLAHANAPDMASLALRLGYFDQPHFIRDFKAVIGRAPGDHIARIKSRHARAAR